MQMTRILFLIFVTIFLGLNVTALMATRQETVAAIIPATLVINAVSWPIALVIAYRIGQTTGIAYLRKVLGRRAAKRSGRGAHRQAA